MKAIYLHNTNKSTPIDFFLPIAQEYALKLGWTKPVVFSDGWDEPEDWNMMVEYATHKTNRLTDVILINLSRWHGRLEQAKEELTHLENHGIVVHVVQTSHFLPKIHDKRTLERAFDIISSWTYFTDVMSLKTREGMRHRKGGRLPYGLTRENGSVVQHPEHYPIVERVMGMYEREVAVPEIARDMNISQSKVRSIIRAWKDR